MADLKGGSFPDGIQPPLPYTLIGVRQPSQNGMGRCRVAGTPKGGPGAGKFHLQLSSQSKVAISACMIQGGKSGVAQYLFALLRALLRRPDCPSLTVFALEQDAPLFGFMEGRATLKLVAERFRPPIRNIAWHQAILPRRIRQEGIDVLHVPSYRRLIWPRPCPLVATIHDLAPFHVRGKYDPARMFYGRVVVRALARRQDAIIAVSGNTARDIQRFFKIPASRLSVILNGLDHDRFHPGDSMKAQALVAQRWKLERPFFLYVSRLEHPGKNHVRLIEAFARFKGSTQSPWLLAFGGSDWHGAEAIHQAAEASPARASIRFLGFVPDAELPVLYQAAGALVYPSLFEGFGFPPVEAMASGCPVLSSTGGALGEVVADAAGLLLPEDTLQMEGQLTRMSTDQAWRRELREAGLRNAQRFDWDKNATQVLQCYQNVTGLKRD